MFKSLNIIKHDTHTTELVLPTPHTKKVKIIPILQNEKPRHSESGMTRSPRFRPPAMLLAAGMGTDPRTFCC